METPDLTVVDHAFGVFADLYSDILRVSVAATHEQIQLAYFDRRSELFTLLAKLDSEKHPTEKSIEQRLGAERKMDAVVLAVRVLGDGDTRLWYDQQRQERLMNRRRAAHGQLPGHSPNNDRSGRGGSSLDSVCMEEGHNDNNDNHHDRSSTSRKTKKSRSEQLKPHAHGKKKAKKRGTSARPKETRTSSSRDKKQAQQQQQQQESSDTNTKPIAGMRSKDTVDTEHTTDDDDDSGGHHHHKATNKKQRTRTRAQEERQDQEDTEDGASCGTDFESASLVPNPSSTDKGGTAAAHANNQSHMLSVITNSRVLKNISEELSGACEDALTSVDQVFNAFTLTDKDITAVLRKIDRAKKQFDH